MKCNAHFNLGLLITFFWFLFLWRWSNIYPWCSPIGKWWCYKKNCTRKLDKKAEDILWCAKYSVHSRLVSFVLESYK